MRQSATPKEVTRLHRWKQHLRRKSYDCRSIYTGDAPPEAKKVKPSSTFVPQMTKIGRYFTKMSLNEIRGKRPIVKINMPRDFCIFSNPEQVIKHCGQVFNLFRRTDIEHIHFDHRKTAKYSLGAEILFGLSTAEGVKYRSTNSYQTVRLDGELPSNRDHANIIRDVGIVSEVESVTANQQVAQNMQLVHVFKSECLTFETPSAMALDSITKTTNEVIIHLNQCLKDLHLELKSSAAERFRKCISEMLDNAVEHCKQTHPAWYVRSYLNGNGSDRFFELSIFNFGCSYADTFTRLSNDHYAKGFVSQYIKNHRSLFDESALYTIAALQGRVSSKNNDEYDNRGQGTIVLIESFENMYNELKLLRPDLVHDNRSMMNLISGKTVITFDGRYKSKTVHYSDGSERVIYPFNDELDLKCPPSSSYIKTMTLAYFPGAMINIRLPLSTNIVAST